jgi:hypothetical protein
MHSKIDYHELNGSVSESKVLCYCKESPREVLEQLYQSHWIFGYRGILQPVDCRYPNNVHGLDIVQTSAPVGTQITGSVTDLMAELEIAHAKEANRIEEVYANALVNRLKTFTKYLSDVEYFKANPHPRTEETLSILKEVMEITLKIHSPTNEQLLYLISHGFLSGKMN